MSETNWLPALLFLGAGLVVGIVLMWRVRRSAPGSVPGARARDEDVRDLRAERDQVLARLREMGEPQEDEGDAVRAERVGLERRCAHVLRTLEDKDAVAVRATPPAERAASAAPAPSSALRGFLVGVGAVVVLGGLLYFASRQSAPTPDQPGGMAATDQDLDALKARVAAQPDDVDARLDLARVQLHQQDMMAVFENTQLVLERDPHNPRAMSYQALVRFAMGQADQALLMLREATTRDPDLLDGWVHLLFVEAQVGDIETARKDLAEAISHFPQHEARLRGLLDEMAAPASAAAPAGGAASEAATVAPATQDTIAGQIDAVDEVLAQVTPGSVVFLSLRPAGEASGMPLAAKKLAAARLPVPFEISGADAMMGGTLPPTVNLEARLDADGDPSTRSPSDPVARVDGVALGSGGVRLLIQLPKEQP